MRVVRAVLAGVALHGCSMVFQGHSIDEKKVAALRPGVTTERELIEILGRPEAIVHKRAENTTVYQYKSMRVFAIGIPWIISIGRTTQTGRLLNVVVKDRTVAGYEETEVTERFFWR